MKRILQSADINTIPHDFRKYIGTTYGGIHDWAIEYRRVDLIEAFKIQWDTTGITSAYKDAIKFCAVNVLNYLNTLQLPNNLTDYEKSEVVRIINDPRLRRLYSTPEYATSANMKEHEWSWHG